MEKIRDERKELLHETLKRRARYSEVRKESGKRGLEDFAKSLNDELKMIAISLSLIASRLDDLEKGRD